MLRTFVLIAAAAAALAAPAIAVQSTAPAGAPSKAEVEAASRTLGVLVGGLQSDQVPENVKSVLFRCIYGAPLGEISARTTEALAKTKGVNANDASDRLSAIAAVCGAGRPASSGAAPKTKAPAGR